MAGKLQPYNAYEPVSYDYVNQLPPGWKLLPNIAIFEERIERGHEKEELLSVTIGKGIIKQTNVEIKKDSSNEDKSKYKFVKEGDLAYNKMRMWQGALGYSKSNGIVSPAYIVLKPKMKINPRFFHYMFRSCLYTNYSKRFSYGIVDDQLSLRYTDFKRMYSIVPPLETQNAIVDYLDGKNAKIDEFIRKKERLIEVLEEKRRTIIDNIVNSKNNYEKGNKPLKYLVKIISDQTHQISDGETYLALENIKSWTGQIDLSVGLGEFDSTVKRFKTGDVLFNKLRPYLAKVVIPEFDGVCVSELLVLRPSKIVCKEFLFYKLISRSFIDYVDSSTFGSKMPRATWDLIGKIEISYPMSLKAQKDMVEKIQFKEKQLERLKEQYIKEILTIKQYQESLISEIVTGKNKVPNSITASAFDDVFGIAAEEVAGYNSNKHHD